MQEHPIPMVARIISGVMGVTFGGIGLTVLSFLWLSPFGAFGSPPLFFRVFASFIAIPFVCIGGGALYGAITGKGNPSGHGLHREVIQHARRKMQEQTFETSQTPSQLACPSCGAPRGGEEISPSGDLKCGHCKSWYNVYS